MPATHLAAPNPERQRGIGLIEFALVLVLVGVIAAMALQGANAVEGFQQTRFVQKVRTLVSQLESFRASQGRWPGDCNRDGLIDQGLTDMGALTAGSLDYAVAPQLAQASSASASYSLGLVCPPVSLLPYGQINVPFNELKWAGQVPAGEPSRSTAAHGLGGFAFLGTFQTVAGSDYIEDKFNVMLLTQVPISAARRLAVAIDGSDGSAANRQRVRRTDDMVVFAPLWTASGETEDKKITVLVFFDRIPPAGS